MASRNKRPRMQWYRMDLHVHTPASEDYLDQDASFIDVLRRAEQRGLDIVAFTDHNTVAGYAAMQREIERLTFLEQLGRAHGDELRVLAEYRRLLDKVLVLPGFEFTATFGFHVLGIFPPDTTVRFLEHLLLTLNVPQESLEQGNSNVGASADVLTAYQIIHEAGGLVIAAHANAAHGVAMRGMNFGGQTRIAYTQDRHLHALELTDLHRKGRGSTQRFFNGTKSEYPRRMHCIQGSDAHSLDTVMEGKNRRFGIGERVTEVLLPERSFESLVDIFTGTDFSRTRPYNPNRQSYDFIMMAREEGPSLVQSFHESMERRGGRLYNIIADVCAFANTNGGTVYVGLSGDPKKKPAGVSNHQSQIEFLQNEISAKITPNLDVQIDAQETQGKTVIRILVPFGEERPYAIDSTKFYVRDEAETNVAVREELVSLVQQGLVFKDRSGIVSTYATPDNPTPQPDFSESATPQEEETTAPRSGVEIVGTEQRNNTRHFIMRDLRNGNVVKNVTRSSARRLWDYAIKQWESNPVKEDKVRWNGDFGLWRSYKKHGTTRYDLVQRVGSNLRIYYGVSESGMHGQWEVFLTPEDRD